ncbi:hypothetical protein, conserved in T. vivax, (fragment), partial [Trypanosoma vivax Y486]
MHVPSGAGALVHPKEGWREKVVLGAEPLACSYRAECVAMEAGLKRFVDVIGLSKTHRRRVVAFTDSLSPLMALARQRWRAISGLTRISSCALRGSVCPSTSSSYSRTAGCHEMRRETRQLSTATQSRSRIRRGSLASSLVWKGRCGTRRTGPLRRVGLHARIAVCCSIAFDRHRNSPSWIVCANRCWHSSERAHRSISG